MGHKDAGCEGQVTVVPVTHWTSGLTWPIWLPAVPCCLCVMGPLPGLTWVLKETGRAPAIGL